MASKHEWSPGDDAWHRAANELARSFAPHIYPCATCEGPVVKGYVCTHCGETDPERAA